MIKDVRDQVFFSLERTFPEFFYIESKKKTLSIRLLVTILLETLTNKFRQYVIYLPCTKW
jgi:hypothetical protein